MISVIKWGENGERIDRKQNGGFKGGYISRKYAFSPLSPHIQRFLIINKGVHYGRAKMDKHKV
jgi:hypothetical protein